MDVLEYALDEYQKRGPTTYTLDLLGPLVTDPRVSKIMLEVLSDRRWAPLWITVLREYRDKVPADLEQRERLRQVLLRILAEEGGSVLRKLTILSLKFFANRNDVENVLMKSRPT
jgi:hypothetical protein